MSISTFLYMLQYLTPRGTPFAYLLVPIVATALRARVRVPASLVGLMQLGHVKSSKHSATTWNNHVPRLPNPFHLIACPTDTTRNHFPSTLNFPFCPTTPVVLPRTTVCNRLTLTAPRKIHLDRLRSGGRYSYLMMVPII